MPTRWLQRAPTHAAWTLVTWLVIEGREDAFIEAWRTLGHVLSVLNQPPIWSVLLQNQHDSRAFSSFGPWPGVQAIEIMRRDAGVQEAFQRLVDCCHQADAGTFRLAELIDSRGLRTPR